MFFHVDNKVFSQITEKITDKSRIIGNAVFTDHSNNKSKITEKITAPITDHINTPSRPLPIIQWLPMFPSYITFQYRVVYMNVTVN